MEGSDSHHGGVGGRHEGQLVLVADPGPVEAGWRELVTGVGD